MSGTSNFNSGFPPVQQQIINQDTGFVSTVWSSWFQLFYNEYVATATDSADVYSQLNSQVSSLTSSSTLTTTAIYQTVPAISYAALISLAGFDCTTAPLEPFGGILYLSKALTPKSSTSTIRIEASIQVSATGGCTIAAGLYRADKSNLLAGGSATLGGSGYSGRIHFVYEEPAVSLLPRTYLIQIGNNSGASQFTEINASNGVLLFAGRCPSGMIITEYK